MRANLKQWKDSDFMDWVMHVRQRHPGMLLNSVTCWFWKASTDTQLKECDRNCRNKQINMEGGQSGTYLRPGAHQSSKAAFCKSAFAKSKLTFGKSAFSRSRFAFRRSIFASPKAMVWPSATSKILSAKTCQNVLKSIFAFC